MRTLKAPPLRQERNARKIPAALVLILQTFGRYAARGLGVIEDLNAREDGVRYRWPRLFW